MGIILDGLVGCYLLPQDESVIDLGNRLMIAFYRLEITFSNE